MLLLQTCQYFDSGNKSARPQRAQGSQDLASWARTFSSAACFAAAMSCLAAISGGGRFSCGPLAAPNAVDGSSQGILPRQQNPGQGPGGILTMTGRVPAAQANNPVRV